MSRKKQRKKLDSKTAELNIMPFIDIFSMLNTFLLVSASFVNIGIMRVQVPFFTNAPEDKSKPARSLLLNVRLEKDKVILTTRWTLPPEEETKTEYLPTKKGLDDLHSELVRLRIKHPEFDKVTLFSEDDIKYYNLIAVLDAIKQVRKGDPDITVEDKKTGQIVRSKFLYEKVVMGSVVL